MWLHTATIKSTVGNKTKLFLSSFLVSTCSRLTLAGAFWNNYVAACSTALRSATEEDESGGYVTVPCPSKEAQHCSTRIGRNSIDVTRLLTTEHIRISYLPSKSRSVIMVNRY